MFVCYPFFLLMKKLLGTNLEVDDSDEEEMMVISDKEALNSLEKVNQYLKNTISYLSIILKTLGSCLEWRTHINKPKV